MHTHTHSHTHTHMRTCAESTWFFEHCLIYKVQPLLLGGGVTTDGLKDAAAELEVPSKPGQMAVIVGSGPIGAQGFQGLGICA